MQKLQFFLLAVVCTAQLVNGGECSGESTDNNHISLSVNSIRSDGGEWETSFLALQNTSHHPRHIDVNVTRSFFKCQGNHIIQIGGIFKDVPQENKESITGKLIFKRSSKNALLANNGRSLQKLKSSGCGSGITDRPLLDNEIFTVRIDAHDGQSGPAIGITQLTLEGVDLKDHIQDYKSFTWTFYGKALYQDGSVVNPNYLKTDISKLTDGHTVGVMRNESGTLYLFIDGVNQGPATSNIPDKVYGIFELSGNINGTIVDM